MAHAASKLDLKTLGLLAVVVLLSMLAGTGTVRLFLKGGGTSKPSAVDVTVAPEPPEKKSVFAKDEPAGEPAPQAHAEVKVPVLPLPPTLPPKRRRKMPPQPAPETPEPPQIAPANFFNYGIGEGVEKSGARLDVPAAPERPRRELQRVPSIGQARPRNVTGAKPPSVPRPEGSEFKSAKASGAALKAHLSRMFGEPDGALRVPLSKFTTDTPGDGEGRTGESGPARGTPAGGIDPRLRRINNATITDEDAQNPAIEPRHATFDMAAPRTLQYRVTDIPKERTVVCYEVLAHPCCPECVGPGNQCESSANYSSFNGNADWRYEGGAWLGTLVYVPAAYGCEGIQVRFVFADKRTGKHAGAGMNVVNGY
ncbi:MAG: hypothetical protein HY553_11505 [Elusimicrobia bacterium]|nr:hypothetical protein [Elusimicrobiota bacterium]